jgi:putative cofactor-binding repeat protein
MESFLLLASIVRSVSVALANPAIAGSDTAEWARYLNFAGLLAERGSAGLSDLRVLDEQLRRAVEADRGLLQEERDAWKAASDGYSDELAEWLKAHPRA